MYKEEMQLYKTPQQDEFVSHVYLLKEVSH